MERFHSRWVGWFALALTFALGSCSASQRVSPAVPQGASGGFAFGRDYLLPGSLSPIVTNPGQVDGIDNRFLPRDGDTKSGGHGSTIDRRVPCLPTMPDNYHVHVFLGIIDNGTYLAIPDGIGMVNPGPEVNGYIDTAQCFYEIHTHDASGIVHIESTANVPPSSSVYRLKEVLDVWGIKYGPQQFGYFKGPLHVFVGTPPALGQTTVNGYHEYRRPVQLIQLTSHKVIWIEIGSGYYGPTQLPPVTFYTEY